MFQHFMHILFPAIRRFFSLFANLASAKNVLWFLKRHYELYSTQITELVSLAFRQCNFSLSLSIFFLLSYPISDATLPLAHTKWFYKNGLYLVGNQWFLSNQILLYYHSHSKYGWYYFRLSIWNIFLFHFAIHWVVQIQL